MINILEKKMYDCTLYIRGRGGPAAKGTGTASFSGFSRDKRKARERPRQSYSKMYGKEPRYNEPFI